jgi:hypothetical protein
LLGIELLPMTRLLHAGVLLIPLVACGPAVPPSDAATDSGSGGPTASTTVEGTDSASDSVTSSATTAGSTGSSDPTSGTTGSTGIDDSGWTGECTYVFAADNIGKPLEIDPGEWPTGAEGVTECMMTSVADRGEWRADLDCEGDEVSLDAPIRIRLAIADDYAGSVVEAEDEPVTLRLRYSTGLFVFGGHFRISDSEGRTVAAWFDNAGANDVHPWQTLVPELLPELQVDPYEWGCEFEGSFMHRAIAFEFFDGGESTTLLATESGVAGNHLITLYGAGTTCAQERPTPNCGTNLQFHAVRVQE